MQLTRSELLQRLAELESSPPDDWRAWFAAGESLVGLAGRDDVEWLRDQLQDAGRRARMVTDDARAVRMQAANGHNAPEPRPHYREFQVSGPEAATDALRAGGGFGATTWGFDWLTRVAWVSHADPKASKAELAAASDRMQAELARLGLSIEDSGS